MSEFLNFMKAQAGQPLLVKQAACLVGKQPGRDVWVFGKDMIIDEEGHARSTTKCV